MKPSIPVPHVSGFEDIKRFSEGKISIVDWPDEFPYAPEVNFFIGHDGANILIRFDVTEEHPRALTTVQNGPVWEDSCVEFFVKEPDSDYYFNFETNCIGVGLASKRKSREDFKRFEPALMSQLGYKSSLPLSPMQADSKTSWYLELTVPFSIICENGGVPHRLLANFYKCGDKTAVPHFLSWSRVEVASPDFHRPEFFGELILED